MGDQNVIDVVEVLSRVHPAVLTLVCGGKFPCFSKSVAGKSAINRINADETSNELVSVETENNKRWPNHSLALKGCLDTSHLILAHPVHPGFHLSMSVDRERGPRNEITRSAGAGTAWSRQIAFFSTTMNTMNGDSLSFHSSYAHFPSYSIRDKTRSDLPLLVCCVPMARPPAWLLFGPPSTHELTV